MAGIFLNHRKGDEDVAVQYLSDRLVDVFGKHQVFLDHEGLPPGREFTDELWRRLDLSTVLLAVIGPRWRPARLHDPDDFVRREIAVALARPPMLVIPVLVNGTPLPPRSELLGIEGLSNRQVRRVEARRLQHDVEDLVAYLRGHLPPAGDDGNLPGKGRDPDGGHPPPSVHIERGSNASGDHGVANYYENYHPSGDR